MGLRAGFSPAPVTVSAPRKMSPWKRIRVGERHFVPDSGVSESATNLYLPHPGLRRDHYQSFLLNCGSAGVWSICRCSLPDCFSLLIILYHFFIISTKLNLIPRDNAWNMGPNSFLRLKSASRHHSFVISTKNKQYSTFFLIFSTKYVSFFL